MMLVHTHTHTRFQFNLHDNRVALGSIKQPYTPSWIVFGKTYALLLIVFSIHPAAASLVISSSHLSNLFPTIYLKLHSLKRLKSLNPTFLLALTGIHSINSAYRMRWLPINERARAEKERVEMYFVWVVPFHISHWHETSANAWWIV